MLSEGAAALRRFVALRGERESSARLGVTRDTIRGLVEGAMPRPATRAKLQAAAGIPAEAWDAPAGSFVATPTMPEPRAPIEREAPSESTSTREDLESTIMDLRADLADARRADSGASWRDKSALAKALMSAVKLLAQIRGETDITEAVVVKSPHFRAHWGAVIEALGPFPEARAAVEAALAKRVAV